MGCGGSKMNAVAPAESIPQISQDLLLAVGSAKKPRNSKSGKSNNSNRSADSGIDDTSSNTSTPVETEEEVTEVVKKLVTQEEAEQEEIHTKPEKKTEDDVDPVFDPVTNDDADEMTHAEKVRAKTPGVAFEIKMDVNATPTRKRMPPRLKAIVATPKRELTLFELDKKLRAAEKLRMEQLEKVSTKANAQNRKVEESDQKLSQQKNKIDANCSAKEKLAIENRRKHMKEMQRRLAEKEAHAKRVRARAHSGSSTRSTASARSDPGSVSARRDRIGSAASLNSNTSRLAQALVPPISTKSSSASNVSRSSTAFDSKGDSVKENANANSDGPMDTQC